MTKILIVEDDVFLAEQVSAWLAHQKYTLETVHDGNEGLARLKLYAYDLVILDWALPGLSGIDLLRAYRDTGGSIPILMLTGKTELDQKEMGLDSGADDYLTKPFHLVEMAARVRALLRRKQPLLGSVLKMRDIELDTATKRVLVCGKEVGLQPKEMALLELFLKHPDTLFSPATLLDKIWSSESEATVDSVYTFIKTLRSKLGNAGAPDVIANVRGLGYRFDSGT